MSKDNEKLKKKEMTNNTEKKKAEPNGTCDTIYKQTVDHEEAEAVLRTGEDDMNVFMQLCSNLRSHILQLKTDTTESPSTLDNIKREASLSFVMLKKLNRLEKYRLKNARDTLTSKKSKVDSFNLQLQNLRYEIHHLKKEVVKCLQFKSKDEDIDLVDEEVFYKDAPEDISRPDITRADPHQLKLARLQWELSQRKELSGLCGQVERENERVAANINKKRGQLDNLAPLLKQLLSVSKPLIENLSYPENPARNQYKLAHLLPEPLYCLFIQTDAYKQAFCPGIEVKINGKEEEAEQVNKMLSEALNPADSDSETEEATNNAPESSSNSKHRHHHHHSKSRTAPVTVKASDKPEDKRHKLCLTHPLTVDLVLKSKGSSIATLTCTFSYLYNLHVVTVKVSKSGIPSPGTAGSNHLEAELLAGLFPEDERVGEEEEGEERTPNLTNHYQLKQAGLTWDASKLGHPYPWVQRLAGLSFPLASSPSVNVTASQTSVPRVVKRLVRRFKSVQELAALLAQLESGQLLEAHQCGLNSWQALSWSQYRSSEVTQYIVSRGIVTSSCPVYKAVLSRATAKCAALVAVNHDYPAVSPVFCVQIELSGRGVRHAANDDAVRDLEKELNVYWKEHGSEGESILRTQIECLASCFDIYLESLGSKDFPRKMSFVRATRGRTRALPYKCASKSEALYTQR